MNIKRILVPVVAVLALTACGSTTASPASVVTVTAAPAPAPATDSLVVSDSDYLTVLHSLNDPVIEAANESDLVSIGHSTCDLLDQGNSITDIVTYLVTTNSYTDAETYAIGEIMGAGVAAFCPQYVAEVTAAVS